MVLKAAISIIVLAALLPFLYDSLQRFSIIIRNAPGRLATINNLKSYEIKFEETVRSCEDGLLVESQGLAILSCDPGREKWNTVLGIFLPGPVPGAEIYAYSYKDVDAPDSESLKRFEILDYQPGADFHTLGMAYDERMSTLFVANHRHDGATIEIFTLDLVAFTAKHLRTIQHPLLHGPNAITLVNSHELLVTNDHYFLIKDSRILATLETYLGVPLATVVHVDISSLLEDPTGHVDANIVARLPFANGISFLNETTVAVVSTSKTAVYIYDISKLDTSTVSTPTLTYKSMIKLPYFVDNIHVSKDGALFVAGHPHPPTMGKYAISRHECNSSGDLAAADPSVQEHCRKVQSSSWVSKWTEAGGIEHLYAGTEYPTSCTAAYDSERKVGIVTGLYAKGILVWRE
ncbi:hypothetical protein F4677DRAFT_381382 [Hypoxylon crocopeplum]|nr:hypothetical protein F4677DRAFT_381382 [Hypoxylon crocopeplum]